jgi:hypothetical protein
MADVVYRLGIPFKDQVGRMPRHQSVPVEIGGKVYRVLACYGLSASNTRKLIPVYQLTDAVGKKCLVAVSEADQKIAALCRSNEIAGATEAACQLIALGQLDRGGGGDEVGEVGKVVFGLIQSGRYDIPTGAKPPGPLLPD